MQNRKATDIEAYILSQPEEDVEKLQQLRNIILGAAPAATETISYQMPAFRLYGMLVGFANWKNHIGFYPWNSTTVAEFSEELKEYETSKGAIQFPKNKRLPVTLIKKIVKARIKDNIVKEKIKAEKNQKPKAKSQKKRSIKIPDF